ncbi:MAG: FeoC-like transcriptional regulator [Methylohalobius sp. ZOD2]|nr:FeoC-like transcriptional regulator [Methylothermaceae bacterium]
MILELRDLLRRHQQIPLRELAAELGIAPETARPMLERLIRKGQVERLPAGTLCGGGCRLCPPDSVEIYRWIKDNNSS